LKAKLGPDHPFTLSCMMGLASSYMAVGRTREAQALLEECSTTNRKDPANFWKVAALQVWFGQDESYAATRQRILAFARGTQDATTALRAAQVGALRPSNDKAVLEDTLDLGRKAVELNKGERELLALGMAEFRNGRLVAADEALRPAAKAGQDATAGGISAFYRAMSHFQLGGKDEARDVAATAVAQIKPLPKDGQGPMAGDSNPDHMILWLAYKEAKAMIGFVEPPAASAKPDGK
jgi:tetratricopeptide (TPR) repeat protein